MEAREAIDTVLNIRPGIILFFGEDTFAGSEMCSNLLGKYTDLQRTLKVSEKADNVEWIELLEEAFQLFTAVSMRKLVGSHRILDPSVQSVPLFIVVRGATDKYASLIEVIVKCADEQLLADKLQFATITDVCRSEDLLKKAASLHEPVEATVLPFVRLQNTVFAISDYWKGTRIGCEEQTHLALARITVLLFLSEYRLEDGHLGYFKNGIFGGRTFWVGLGSYSVDRIDVCANAVYADILREKISDVLFNNPKSIIGELRDDTYSMILSKVAKRVARPSASDGNTASLTTEYTTEVVPLIIESICSRVQSRDELITVLEHLARRLRAEGGVPAYSSFSSIAPLLIVSTDLRVVLAITGIGVIGGVIWLMIHHRRKRPFDGDSVKPLFETDDSTERVFVPHNAALADILDDLRRELISKLEYSTTEVHANQSEVLPDGLLVGEQRLNSKQMFNSDSARTAGKAALEFPVDKLILLALESGKWRNSTALVDLSKLQREATSVISKALQRDFTDWALSREQNRLVDESFVQEVLYAPPPAPGATISSVCISPVDFAVPELPMCVDRSYLTNCFHFLYLVDANVSI